MRNWRKSSRQPGWRRLLPTASPSRSSSCTPAGRKTELGRIYRQPWFVQPPLILCVCGVPSQGWVRSTDHRRYLDVDVAIVMDHMILAATELGLGTCWIAAFNAPAAREALQLPDEIEPLIFTPVGLPGRPAGSQGTQTTV